MNKNIIKVFHEGRTKDLALEDIRGGWCIVNAVCKSDDAKCNVYTCNKANCPDNCSENDNEIKPDPVTPPPCNPNKISGTIGGEYHP